MTVALTTADIAVIGPPPHPPIRVTSLATAYLGGPHNAYRQVTTVCFHVIGEQPAPKRNMTTINYTILATRTPLYRFTNVILPDVFPYDISYNSVGSTRFATDVIVVDSGDDQRTQRWDQPLMEYDIAYGVRTMEQLHALISFFRAMRGRLYAFNYKDPVDHSSTLAMATEARSPPPPMPFDQQIGSGDGLSYQFQLSKTYRTPSGLANQVRSITRPDPASVRAAVNGAEISTWTVDADTGIVTLLSPVALTIGHAISKAALGNGGYTTITGQPGDFNALKPYAGRGRGVVLSGFQNSVNNVPQSILAPLTAVAGDGSAITVLFSGNFGTMAEIGTTNATIAINPAPAPNDTITAGFQFYVPCRFDTDTLPVQLEDYGIGSSNSIKLIEVRPSAF